ncbi:predicted protein [Nematostella vectensis]|uniref:Uncharacterized protein n=1 Tax=Nematostella vectensis TaxID=45351 RepID=A7T2M2_NEMVE|nr:predicted protein [Nematostella vectensis]|eukprot:XP_001621893.1 hypothetical protein NEMVEDRAFT_v1g221454 [Nematostella vectensis]
MGSLHQGGNISREDQEYLQKFFDPAYELRTKILYDALINYSHQIEGILSMQWFGPCKWQGQPCNATNFTHIIDLKMGKCYTFKSNLKSSLVGPNNGLRLRLNLEESDHVRNAYVPMSGFKVVIHDRWEYPFPDEEENEEFCSVKDVFECIYPKFYGQALPDKVAKCANSCPEACSYTKYDAKLSYANAVGNAFSQSLPPVTSEGAKSESYKRLLNLTVEKREKYFRYVGF